MKKHKTFEEREEILKLHIDKGYSTRFLSKEYNISRTTIQNWIRAYRKTNNLVYLPRKKAIIKGLHNDNATIKKLRAEIQILKSFLQQTERGSAKN